MSLLQRLVKVSLRASQVYKTKTGITVIFSLPRDTNSIKIIPPMDNTKGPDEYLEIIQVLPMEPDLIKMASDKEN